MPLDPQQRELGQLLSGDALAQPIAVIARLGIPGLLADGPRTLHSLAAATGAHEATLGRVLRALAAMGVLRRPAPDTFEGTPLSARLQPGNPMHAVAMLAGAPSRVAAHHLGQAVEKGEDAFVRAHGTSFYDYLSRHPEEAALFDEVQAQHWEMLAIDYDFSAVRKVVDVGGGRGELLARLLEKHPALVGALVERPEVLARAEDRLSAWRDRVELHADFFAGVPSGGDIYVLAFVLHNWADGPAVELLTRCREAMPDHARMLVIENLLDGDPAFVALLDLEMLIYSSGGRERYEHEYAELLSRAGLRLARRLSTDSSVSLLEAVPDRQP